MHQSITAAILLIQFCVQCIPLAIADEDIVSLPEGGSGSVIAPVAESGSWLPVPVPSSESGAVRATSSGVVIVSSGAVVGTGTVLAAVLPPMPAASFPVRVVVSEVMWMGSNFSTADEWVEIAGFGSGANALPRSVSGWTLFAVKAGIETRIATLPDVMLGSGSTFVLANAHASTSRLSVEPNLVTTAMSLPNTQLLLRLNDASGAVVDEVDDGVGVPMAGANPSGGGPKASMERVDPWKQGNVVAAWKTATLSLGFDDGPPIFGTPGFQGIPVSSSSSWPPGLSSSSSSLSSSSASTGVPVVPVQVPPLVRLTEIMANPPGVDTDEWIEIGSFELETVDLAEFSVRTGTTKHALAGALVPGGYRRIGKIESGVPLSNTSGTVELLWRDKVIDAWTYAETAEGVSVGRSWEGVVTPQCVPSPDAPNTDAPLDPFIRIQTSSASNGQASFNLEAAVIVGSMAGAVCSWAYPDGYANGSCNPPSHSMTGPVYGDVILTLRDYCGNTMIRTMRMDIVGKTTANDDVFACIPTAFTGVVVSELLPNPDGQDDDAEWIEIANVTDDERALCGWSIDDDGGGSDPFRLDRLRLPGGERLLVARPDTGIALNNDKDAVRLFAPQPSGGSGAYQIVRYISAPEGRSYARRDDGVFLWTLPTPENTNAFESVRWPASVDVRIVQAMPNPKGADTDGGEWIELRNETPYPLPLTGWSVRTANDEASLDGVILSPKDTKRMTSPVALGNFKAFVRLVDRDGIVVSTLAWKNTTDGHSVASPRSEAHVSDLSLLTSDDCVSWSAETPEHVRRNVRIGGISSSNISECLIFISALSKEHKFEYEMYSQYTGSMLSVHGTDLASLLLRKGIAIVDHRGTSPFLDVYALDEQEAREARRGIWAQEGAEALIDETRSIEQQRLTLAEKGLVIHADPAPGVIDPGTPVSLSSNVPARIEVAVGTGAFREYVEPVALDADSILRIRAAAITQSSTGSLYIINSFQPYYIRKSRYTTLAVSEVYPSPKSVESEWVELWNPTRERVSLAGWLIDDAEGVGSRPDLLPFDAVLEPGERRAFSGSSVAWNNGGDDVRLIDPNGRVSHAFSYGPVKKGMAYAVSFLATGRVRGGCITAEPTPGAINRCVDPSPAVRSKKSSTKASSKGSIPVRYRNVVRGVETTPAVRPVFSAIFDAGIDRIAEPSTMLPLLVFCLLTGLFSISILRLPAES